MTDVFARSRGAARLLADEDLLSVFNEIEEAAIRVFRNTASSPEDLVEAHRKVKSIETVRNALQDRITAAAVLAKKENRHRGND